MSVNKVQLANGETIIDISDSTVTPETLAEGVIAHDASGQKITGRMVPGGGASVQSDWNQTDETAADFIKNKPFGDFPTVLYEGTDLAPMDEEGAYVLELPTFELVEGQSYSVVIEGTEYVTVGANLFGVATIIGNASVMGGEDNGLPFACMANLDTGVGMMFIAFVPFTSICIVANAIKKIEQKYLTTGCIVLERNLYDDVNARYLHKTYNGDESDRVTLKELMAFVDSGRAIYLNINEQKYAPVLIDVSSTSNYGSLKILSKTNIEYTTYYTSEYTPTT